MLHLDLPRLRFQLLIVGIQYLGFSSQSDTNFHNSKPIVGFELLEITPIHEHPNQLFVTWFKFFHSADSNKLFAQILKFKRVTTWSSNFSSWIFLSSRVFPKISAGSFHIGSSNSLKCSPDPLTGTLCWGSILI